MKIYQMIYTSVKHSLSDVSKGLVNQSGMRVYSCSEGVTRENIQEILRFSQYRMPKKAVAGYSETPCDPSVPELFPKIFRTMKLSDGRYAAVQIVYSGMDFNGDRGNYYAHALIFDEPAPDFFPEQYYNSPLFTTYLTPEQIDAELIQYMPEAEPKRDETLDNRVKEFINEHKHQMEFLTDRALDMFTDDKLRNICIATDKEELSAMYLVALKYLLPRDISRYTGISTFNVYLPSDKQYNIVFHGTVNGNNNITSELAETRTSCIYIDIGRTNFYTDTGLPIFDMDLDELRERYAVCGIGSVAGFLDWCGTYTHETETGIGGRLLKLQQSAGDMALKSRLVELLEVMDDDAHKDVWFELAKILYDNSEKLPSKEAAITDNFISQCVKAMCDGSEYPISDNCADMTETQARIVVENIREYMKAIHESYDNLTEFNKKSFVEFFAVVKHAANKATWRELFMSDETMITDFVSMAADQVIQGRGAEMFAFPKHWDDADLSEMVAYIHAAAADDIIKRGCLKYILTYRNEDWRSYGVTIAEINKTADEQQNDLARVRRMLKKVGYLPFERATYEHLKLDVRADITGNLYPLLLSKVLNAYYNWRAAAGRQTIAHERAGNLRELLSELREKEPQVYNFVIPKLALEIVEAPGHYHELIVNADTMPETFWNWFIIGYNRCKPDDNRLLIYHRIYLSNKAALSELSIAGYIIQVFRSAR